MDTLATVAWMISAACLVAAVQHLLVGRRRAGRDHVWFALVCLATALAAATYASGATCAVTCLAALLWSVAVSGFIAVHAPAHGWRSAAAWWVPPLVAVAFATGPLELRFEGVDVDPGSRALLRSLSIVIGGTACALLVLLAADAMRGEWSAGRRARALALAGLGLAGVGWSGLHGQPLLAPSLLAALSVVLVCILAMATELASDVLAAETVSQRQRQELAHASRLAVVGELTASIAHEINQPLGAILSNADASEILMERAEPPLEEVRRILADIRRDGLRASDVIRHVRTLARKRELDLQLLDANALALEVTLLLEDESQRRRIALPVELSLQPAPVLGDRALLEQVLINLVMNAMDAVESAIPDEDAFRPPVVLGVGITAYHEVEWRIVDAGSGIPDDKLDRLFDSFYTSKPHGMGLGLSIARSIVQAHGGRIQAENNRRSGATFRVILPPAEPLTPANGPAVRRQG